MLSRFMTDFDMIFQLKLNIATEKKLIKEITDDQSVERKNFETKMRQEYKLKKERWKREMAGVDTPKRQREQASVFHLLVFLPGTITFLCVLSV